MKRGLVLILVLSIVLPMALPVCGISPPPAWYTLTLEARGASREGSWPLDANINVWVDTDDDGNEDDDEIGGIIARTITVAVLEGRGVTWTMSAPGYLPMSDTVIMYETVRVVCTLRQCVTPEFVLSASSSAYGPMVVSLDVDAPGQFGIDRMPLVAWDGFLSEPLLAIWSPSGSVIAHEADVRWEGIDYDLFIISLSSCLFKSRFMWQFTALRENITLYAFVLEGILVPPKGLESMLTAESLHPPEGVRPLNMTWDASATWIFLVDDYRPCEMIPRYPSWTFGESQSIHTPDPAVPSRPTWSSDDQFRTVLVCIFVGVGYFGFLVYVSWRYSARKREMNALTRKCRRIHSEELHAELVTKSVHTWVVSSVGNELYRVCKACGRVEKQEVSWRELDREGRDWLLWAMLEKEV